MAAAVLAQAVVTALARVIATGLAPALAMKVAMVRASPTAAASVRIKTIKRRLKLL